jgi:drug/metabolite transporter (DMT)-like permease
MGILYGLLAAFFWGLGDFFITHLTRRVGTWRALLCVQVLSLLAWVILLLALGHQVGGDGSTPLLGTIWLITIVTGIFHVVALFLAYRAFEVGTLALVSPIVSGFAVITALLALGSGERPPLLTLLGTACLIGGVIVASRAPADPEQTGSKAGLIGVPEAIGSALTFGAMFWLFYFYVEPKLGYVVPLIALKIMASSGSLLSVMLARSKPDPHLATASDGEAAGKPSTATVAFLALAAALADTIAWLAYIWGSRTQYATVVTALASLFSVVTVLLAWAFLRERLAPHQWLGVATILLGILLVSI